MYQLQLIIPEPCHENWNDMTPDKQGRFCNSCAKTVIDFSVMTDTQVLNHFANMKGQNICGRVHTEQLQRTFSPMQAPPKKIFRYWQYILTFFLLLGKSQQSKGQGGIRQVVTTKNKMMQHTAEAVKPEDHQRFQIVDAKGHAVCGASVKFISSGNYCVADSMGYITLNKAHYSDTIEITAIGFEQQKIAIAAIEQKIVRLTPATVLLQNVVVTSGEVKGKLSNNYAGGIGYIVVNTNPVRDTLISIVNILKPAISVYPNPVVRGGMVNVSFTLKKAGRFGVHITDVTGKLVMANNYAAIDKKTVQQISIPGGWSGGIYFLIVTDEQGKKVGSEKILVR